MFTGLVQGTGRLQTLAPDKVQITCAPRLAGLMLADLALGDSVAVDGVCLTVESILPQGFIAVVSPETRDRSTLGTAENRLVNLETSLRVGSKVGGHFVTGHVDGMGHLASAVQTSTSWELAFTAPAAVARYILVKGSVAVNGISLTVAHCNQDGSYFTVAVIPHTYAETNLHQLQPGNPVNLEGDLLGKYVEKFLCLGPVDSIHSPDLAIADLTPAFLAEHGYG